MVFVGVKKSGEMMKTKKRENTRTFFSVQFYY